MSFDYGCLNLNALLKDDPLSKEVVNIWRKTDKLSVIFDGIKYELKLSATQEESDGYYSEALLKRFEGTETIHKVDPDRNKLNKQE